MSDSLTGLLFCCFCVGMYWWFHHRKTVMEHERFAQRLPQKVPDWAQASPVMGMDLLGDSLAYHHGGTRRPYVVYQGELREVLHRKGIGQDVCCTLRPQVKGGTRLRVTVPKGDILWIDSSRGD